MRTIHMSADQFGFLKVGQFEEVMRRIAKENDIPMICSCGVCTLDADGADEVKHHLIRASLDNQRVNQVAEEVASESYHITRAAIGNSHEGDTSEERLRQF